MLLGLLGTQIDDKRNDLLSFKASSVAEAVTNIIGDRSPYIEHTLIEQNTFEHLPI